MKKMKILTLILLSLTLLFSSCNKKSDNKKEVEKTPSNVTQKANDKKKETPKEESKKSNSNKDTTKKSDEKVANNSKQKEQSKSDDKSELQSDSGLYLGMDESNFAAIFTSKDNKDTRFQIGEDLDFSKSNVEIGNTVNIKYRTSKDGVKILEEISKVEQ